MSPGNGYKSENEVARRLSDRPHHKEMRARRGSYRDRPGSSPASCREPADAGIQRAPGAFSTRGSHVRQFFCIYKAKMRYSAKVTTCTKDDIFFGEKSYPVRYQFSAVSRL